MCDIHSDAVLGTRCGDECCPGYSKHACAVCAAPLCTACAEPCMSCGESGTPAAVFCGDCCPPAADCCPAHSLDNPAQQPQLPGSHHSTSHALPRQSVPVHHETLVRLNLPCPLRCFGCSSVCCDTCSDAYMYSCSVCDVSACEECLGLVGGWRGRDLPSDSADLPACDWNLCPCCDTWQCVACTFEMEWPDMPTRVGRKRMSADMCLACTHLGAEYPKRTYDRGGWPLDAKTVGKSVRAALRGHPELQTSTLKQLRVLQHGETRRPGSGRASQPPTGRGALVLMGRQPPGPQRRAVATWPLRDSPRASLARRQKLLF